MILPLADKNPIGPFAEPRPSMRGRYLIRNPQKAHAIAAMDAALSLVPRKKAPLPDRPQRILVANWGHLGDVTTTFGAITRLRNCYPGARIGMIVGSWGRPAISDTGLVDDLHVVDHWGLNRASLSKGEKQARYRETRAAALQAISAARYELAIDLYPFFPPAHPLFYRAGIPTRIGFVSGGFGPLLTHAVGWPDADRPIADQYGVLLDILKCDPSALHDDLRPHRSRAELAALPAEIARLTPYVVLHPGAGAAHKDWGFEKWRDLLARLRSAYPGLGLVVTGAGEGEAAVAEALAATTSDVVSMVGRANWSSFVRILADATLVICPDTVTGHVAALFDVPTISIFTGTNNASQWRPYSNRAHVLVRPVLCSPCNLNAGCEAMACIRDVSVEEVVVLAAKLLPDRLQRYGSGAIR